MKKIMGFLALLTLTTAFAGEVRLVKVKELGVMKNKVIFQSLDVKKVKNSNVVRGKLVAQWGTQVFEVVTGYYTCNTKNVCKLTDYERVATYESCKVKNNKVSCSKKIAGDSYESDSRDVIVSGNPDEVSDEFGHNRTGEYDSEFPVRIQDEYSDIF
ncbi:hypothetical protein DOM21_09985 [Bacteriovorax stolpii]|uniref:Uncharacterized protein n=1 Tax=Bacteriovorax stolpii TaxID=960 RepID=A0A2K9NU25_BACTC|nr:hypothetical protein [Bacteriovorax stolpii]AUN98244.1 hypothetical protein C0V70_09030 [Bacteriovorax stolpii]QDK41774.1 hypothetical protein DOM21_09985 [Bacteriovorax stolpii]TDP52166.1 hypothetical protein C8D79_2816 [Bacteriovorax stolpii]